MRKGWGKQQVISAGDLQSLDVIGVLIKKFEGAAFFERMVILVSSVLSILSKLAEGATSEQTLTKRWTLVEMCMTTIREMGVFTENCRRTTNFENLPPQAGA